MAYAVSLPVLQETIYFQKDYALKAQNQTIINECFYVPVYAVRILYIP